jgi:hypothetical protein
MRILQFIMSVSGVKMPVRRMKMSVRRVNMPASGALSVSEECKEWTVMYDEESVQQTVSDLHLPEGRFTCLPALPLRLFLHLLWMRCAVE